VSFRRSEREIGFCASGTVLQAHVAELQSTRADLCFQCKERRLGVKTLRRNFAVEIEIEMFIAERTASR